MKILKWIVGILIGLVLLGVIAVGILSLVVKPEKIKQEVAEQFQEKTGHSLVIDAPVEWSVFPWVGLHLEKVKVGNAPGFGSEPLAAVDYLDVKVELAPLLKKRISVDTVVLKGVELNLERNKAGKANWEGLTGGKKSGTPAEKEKKTAAGAEKGAAQAYSFSLKGVELEKVDLNYRDAQKGQAIHLKDLYVRLGELKPDAAVPLRLGLSVENGRPAVRLKVALASKLTTSADYQRIDLSDLAVKLDARGEGLPDSGIQLKLTGGVGLDLTAGRLAVKDLAVTGPDVNLTGAFQLSGLNSGKTAMEGRLALQQTNLKSLLELAGVRLETADPKALTRVTAQLDLKQQEEALRIEPLKVTLDDSHIQGRVALLSFDGPVVRAKLDVDDIDLDRYLPPSKEKPAGQAASQTPKKQKGEAVARQKPVDFTPLRKLDADATLTVGKLKVNRLRLEKVVVTLTAKKGVLRLDPVGALLYQGKLNANGRLDVRKSEPAIQAGSSLSGIQIGPLLADLTGKDRLTGTGNVKFKLRTRGLQDIALRRNLNGDFAVSLHDGAYKGFDLAEVIRKARAAIKGETLTTTGEAKTDFAELRGTGVVRNGVVTNKDLYMASPILRVKGEGQVDLVQEKIDYRVMAKLVGSLKGQGGESMDELKGIPIPVRITGALADPKPTVDAQALVKALAQKKIEEKKEEVIQKATKKIEEKLGPGALKGLFGK